MGIWQSAAYLDEGSEPWVKIAGTACQIHAFPEHGG
jgi:hypothetical protein